MAAVGALLLAAVLSAVLVARVFFNDSRSPAGTGSGIAATQVRSVPPFTALDLTGANNVIVRVGAKQSVVVHADDNLLGRVTTRVQSGTLLIGNTPGELNAKTPMFVTVSVPSLDAVNLIGYGNIAVNGLNARGLTAVLEGAGNIEAAGTVTTLEVTISGAGTAMLGHLIARDAAATVTGTGTIRLTATTRLEASMSGTGTILYGGNPQHVTTTSSGTGTIGPG